MLLFRGTRHAETTDSTWAGTPALRPPGTGDISGSETASAPVTAAPEPHRHGVWPARQRPTLRILVANRKGGCGKSTIATNLAGAYAVGGLRTALADLDPLRCSFEWLAERPGHVAPIRALDWSSGRRRIPPGIDRLIIDAPAGIGAKTVEALLPEVDVVIVPILPSAFDEGSVEPFLARLQEARRVRNGKARIGVIRNRYRPDTRAGGRLDRFFGQLACADLGGLPDRTVYAEAAAYGLSLFDLPGKRLEALRQDWVPLLRFIERLPAKAAA